MNGVLNMAGHAGLIKVLTSVGGTIDVAGDVGSTGVIQVGTNVTGDILVTGDMFGTIDVGGDLSGDIDVGGEITFTGIITVDGTLQSTGRILVDGLCYGDITIGEETEASSLIHVKDGLESSGNITINTSQGDFHANGTIVVGLSGLLCPGGSPQGPFAGTITIKDESGGTGGGDLTELIAMGCLLGGVSGSIVVERNMNAGEIRIRQSATATIDVNGALRGAAKIFVRDLYDGALAIGQHTVGGTMIHLQGGLGLSGAVTINESRGNFNAGGTIFVGEFGLAVPPLPDITYEGSIIILDDTLGNGGDLNGGITVAGCHDADPLHDMDICVCGDINGSVVLIQTECVPQSDWSCLSGCP